MSVRVTQKILLTPGPVSTSEGVKAAMRVPDICPREEEFCRVMQEVRAGLVRVVEGTDFYEAVTFGCSGTGAVEACLSSVMPEKGKLLVIDNGAYGERMAHIARIYYGKARVVSYKIPHSERPNLEGIEKLLKQHKDICYLALVHHETTTGMLNPAPEILKLAQSYKVGVLLDAMSSYAGIPIDVRQDNYDFIISNSNKCIQGMPGIGFVLCRRDRLEALAKRQPKNCYLDLWNQYDYLKRTGQMPFTPPVQIFYALRVALAEFFAETQSERTARYRTSWETLIAGLEKLNLKPLLPLEYHSKILTAVIEPTHPNYSFKEMHDELYAKDITIYPGKTALAHTFRIANLGELDSSDIRIVLDELREYLTRKGIS